MSKAIIEQLTIQSAMIGMDLTSKALEAEDVVFFRSMRDITVELYDTLIELVNDKPDFIQWRDLFLKINATSPMNQLDTSGRFSAIAEQLSGLDYSEYYFTEVLPVLTRGSARLVAERDALTSQFDNYIQHCVNARRSKMHIVG